MGANPTQGLGLLLFLIAFAMFAVSLSAGSFIAVIGGVALLAGSMALFLKAKPLEHAED
jgi:membrane-bound ClpP family serine protease